MKDIKVDWIKINSFKDVSTGIYKVKYENGILSYGYINKRYFYDFLQLEQSKLIEVMSVNKLLKPCPFCGSPVYIEHINKSMYWEDEEDQFKIYCENEDICMLSNGTTNFYDLEDMINKWNNRT